MAAAQIGSLTAAAKFFGTRGLPLQVRAVLVGILSVSDTSRQRQVHDPCEGQPGS
jgi:hypothetical protein